MDNINNEKYGDPIIVLGETVSVYIIVSITIISFLIFWCWVIYNVTKDNAGDKLYLSCPPGQCGTNINNGEKRCPNLPGDTVLIDPRYEVCNSKFLCDNVQTPYAVLADGRTNNGGICDKGNPCRCVKYPQCATHVSSLFTVINGSLSSNTPETDRFTFQQIPMTADLGTANVVYEESNTNFCGVKTNHLNRLSPGSCSFSDFDYNNPYNTVNVVTECINENPCVKGIMALDTDKPSFIEKNGVSKQILLDTPVTCINASLSCGDPCEPTPCTDNICPEGEVPYWDNRWGTIRCATINYPETEDV